MRPFTSTIPLAEAQRLLAASVRPVERVETVPLADAAGRVAAADIASPVAVPPFARAVMDGYAVVAADTERAAPGTPVTLRVIDRLHAGTVPTRDIAPGTCAEIATGAPLPHGADAVVMVEQTRTANAQAGSRGADNQVEILTAVRTGQHIARRGADIAPGSVVVRTGDMLTPARLGALAAVGQAAVAVYSKPRVVTLSTGAEIVEPGQPLENGRIYDANRFTLGAVIAAHGGVPIRVPPVADELDALMSALDSCRGAADLIVCSGGSSVGERDLVVDVIRARHGELVFHGVAMKPGMPTAFARVDGMPFFGMPGNPTSCLTNAFVLLVPFLRAMARLPAYAPRIVRSTLAQRVTSPAGRHQFYTVRLDGGVAIPAFKGSGEITSLSEADGYFEIPPGQDVVEEGAEVEVTLF